MSNDQNKEKQGSGLSILIPVALVVVLGFLLPPSPAFVKSPGIGLVLTWLVLAILIIIIIGIIGRSLNKGWCGILIDNRNMMSLSRLQIVLWTVVILSAFVTVALARVSDSRFNPDGYNVTACMHGITEEETEQEPKCTDPLGIQLPLLLWALMGISVTSAVGSSLLKTNKEQRTLDKVSRAGTSYDTLLTEVKSNLSPPLSRVSARGSQVKKEKWEDAKFSDVFMGEEVSNFMYVDVAKVQNFFFTMITVVAYTVALSVAMLTTKSIALFFKFPDLPAGLIAVISISHGGYLTDKAFTHTTL